MKAIIIKYKSESLITLISFLALGIATATFVLIYIFYNPKSKTCESYKNEVIRYLPVDCLNYWTNRK